MKRIRATLIDADYVTKEGRPVVRLIMKGKTFFRMYDESFEPYFYVEVEDLGRGKKELAGVRVMDRGKEAVVKKVEEAELWVRGKKKVLLKVICKHPSHVPLLRSEVAKAGSIYEHDIPFARRYLMDRKISPFDEVEAECEGRIIRKIKKVGEGTVQLRALAFDIETYNPRGEPDASKDPVIMISYAGETSGVLTYKEVEGAEFVRRVAGEREMIEEFCALLRREDVELMLGYNSGVFDLPYLKERAERCGIKLAVGRDGGDFKVRRRGMNDVAKITGRIHVDLYLVARFLGIIGAIKTPQYTLKKTYAEIVGKEKEKAISKAEVWRLWDDAERRRELADYSLDDAVSTKELGDKILPMEIELSRICGATLFDVVGASASQLVELLLMRRSSEKKMLIPNRPDDEEAGRRKVPVKGAYVKMPKAGIYDNLAVLDFRGLYPSIICSYNLDPFTLEKEGEETENIYLSPAGHAFSKEKKGIVPMVLEEILDKRARVKKELRKWEKEPESSQYRQLYARSQALKVLANSYYGYLLYSRSRWYSREAGESTTAWGRHYIREMEKKAEKAGFEVVYMDTDSLFLGLGSKGKKEVKAFLKEVNESLPGKMELELEGFYPRGVFVMKKGSGRKDVTVTGAKKKYALLDENGRIKIRGFELVRRDWSKIAKDTQMAVLEAILKEGSKEKAKNIVKQRIEELRNGKTKKEDLVIYTRLRKGVRKYEVISPEVAAVKKAQAKGIKVEERGLIGYVITKRGKRVSDKARLAELAEDYDANYYIDRQILPAVMKILGELGYEEDDLKMSGKQSRLGDL
ncbi:DNA polymerase [Candidatus Micrarchaeota archaeon]|nr:MAG: DNA polymerase [Candidatus Micrarchaeota archaeon]